MSIVAGSADKGTCTYVNKFTVQDDSKGKDYQKLKGLVDQIYNGVNDGVDDDKNGIANEQEFGLSYFYKNLPSGDLGKDTVVVAAWLSVPANQKLYDEFTRSFKVFSQVKDCRIPKPDPSKKTACDYISQERPASPDFFYAVHSFRKAIAEADSQKVQSLTYYVYGNVRQSCPYFGEHAGMVTFTWPESECVSKQQHHHHH